MNFVGTVSKYIISGLLATAVMFGALVFFREVLDIWYLYSSTLAFILAFLTSFLLQKFWTFRDLGESNAHKQLTLFLAVSLINLGINGLGMFILVDKVGVWYLAAQFFVSLFIAIWSFFAYRTIFSSEDKTQNRDVDDTIYINNENKF